MAELTWSEPQDRFYESGLDRVLFTTALIPGAPVIPWSGVTSITNKTKDKVTTAYYDGRAVHDLTDYGDTKLKVKAITRNPAFYQHEGTYYVKQGVYLPGQAPSPFNFSWRSRINDPDTGDAVGYKINFVYDVIAIPTKMKAETIDDAPGYSAFEWDFVAAGTDVNTAGGKISHYVLDTTKYENQSEIDLILDLHYGTPSADPWFQDRNLIATWLSVD